MSWVSSTKQMIPGVTIAPENINVKKIAMRI
jgi:hypothetical protein